MYVPDRINRKSTYKKDFVDYKKQSKNPQKTKPKQQQSPHKIVGGKKEGISLHCDFVTVKYLFISCCCLWFETVSPLLWKFQFSLIHCTF